MFLKPVLVVITAGLAGLASCAQMPAGERAIETEAVPAPVQVMVLGVYHFDNPGLDINNIETDDILSARRQRELDALGRSLASFRPTAVAVEVLAEPPYIDPGYARFTPDDLLSEPSEDIQIGYRVANLAGLDTVYAINEQTSGGEPDYFPYDRVAAFAESVGRADDLAAIADMSGLVEAFETHQETWSVPALLELHNSGFIPDDFYWDIISFGEGETQPGAELAGYWLMRNAKIFNKLQQVTEPGDRVLVVYGSGHRAWLTELVERSNGYQLVDPLPYLARAKEMLSEQAE